MKLTLNRLKVFEFIKSSATWVDVSQVVHHTGVNASVVNKCLRVWAEEGVLERNDSFHAYLYCLVDEHEQCSAGRELAAALRILQGLERQKLERANGDQPQPQGIAK